MSLCRTRPEGKNSEKWQHLRMSGDEELAWGQNGRSKSEECGAGENKEEGERSNVCCPAANCCSKHPCLWEHGGPW